ncbi:helix-turn-helix domain-containing protein [Sphingomonas daechungensis]|uniref:helix-turn-helix domain-containing protein n=1 Tax=Sphingomonas daechungensis TaxID=1176646 RepID=UPI003784854A
MMTHTAIRTAMDAAGISSAADLARQSGLSEVTVRSYLNGSRRLTKLAPAAALSRVLNVPVENLISAHAGKNSAHNPGCSNRNSEGAF